MKTLSKAKAIQNAAAVPSVNTLRIAASVADTETVTIGGTVYEFDADATATAGNVSVDVSGGLTPAVATTALVAAINANQGPDGIGALEISANEILVWDTEGRPVATTETLAGTDNAFATATLTGGVPLNSTEAEATVIMSRAATAQDVALGSMHFIAPFAPRAVMVMERIAAGSTKAWDGNVTITGRRITLDNAGATDFAATDIVTIQAVGPITV